jgi:hypothetical protein
MMRLCLIGNSHLACLKLGWDAIGPRYLGVAPTWFAAGGKFDLRVEFRCLIPTTGRVKNSFAMTTGGETVIDPLRYDAFVLCGLLLSIRRAVHLAINHKPHNLENIEAQHLVSDELFKIALMAEFEKTPALIFARMLRSLTDRKIILFPVPMPSERIADRRKPFAPFQNQAACERLATLFRDAVAALAESVTVDVTWQPHATITKDIFTLHEFSEGSARLLSNRLHAENDLAHMNAAFGALAMEHILGRLGLTEATTCTSELETDCSL